MSQQPRRIVQPTTFGNPRPKKDRRFYRIAARWLSTLNAVLFPLVVASFLVFVALLVYAGLGIDHSQIFVSDGTVFSCQIDAVKLKRKP